MMIAATVNAVAAARVLRSSHKRFALGVGRGEHLVVVRLADQPFSWSEAAQTRETVAEAALLDHARALA